MIRSFALRTSLLAVLLAPAAFAVKPAAPSPRVAFDPAEVVGVEVGKPQLDTCEADSPCVALPLAMKAVGPDGSQQTVVQPYPVTPHLLDDVRRDLGQTADGLVRHVVDALRQGRSNPDPSVKTPCAEALPVVGSALHYKVEPGVQMPLHVETKVAEIANGAFNLDGHPLVVTSGTRTPEAQAEAMLTKVALGENILRLYRDKTSVSSALHAYRQARHEGLPFAGGVSAMAGVIQAQMDKGVFISNHLHAGAVDIRIRDLSPHEKMDLYAVAQQTPGVRIHPEDVPPHLHMDIE